MAMADRDDDSPPEHPWPYLNCIIGEALHQLKWLTQLECFLSVKKKPADSFPGHHVFLVVPIVFEPLIWKSVAHGFKNENNDF